MDGREDVAVGRRAHAPWKAPPQGWDDARADGWTEAGAPRRAQAREWELALARERTCALARERTCALGTGGILVSTWVDAKRLAGRSIPSKVLST